MTKTAKTTSESVDPKVPVPQTKRAMVVALLSRPHGASLAEIVTATGWLAHTARAALSGLKKQGHALASDKADGVRRYRITGGIAQ
ncbi:MAG: DUF3489 domain-containing protein [Sphingomonadales bacterium]|nr:DUF3489 domain-containing protein [Sphingomonadales bacterium]MBK6491096.1 DUF3489 domain-containing protein [Sphingomonadales bacterium]MBK6718319.1 DUF3489 domain-containing protein [Sphingomonadales bacterium]MBL0116462.1 DUF3489 domain-containing protein [Sphingomonadales bacterium]